MNNNREIVSTKEMDSEDLPSKIKSKSNNIELLLCEKCLFTFIIVFYCVAYSLYKIILI